MSSEDCSTNNPETESPQIGQLRANFTVAFIGIIASVILDILGFSPDLLLLATLAYLSGAVVEYYAVGQLKKKDFDSGWLKAYVGLYKSIIDFWTGVCEESNEDMNEQIKKEAKILFYRSISLLGFLSIFFLDVIIQTRMGTYQSTYLIAVFVATPPTVIFYSNQYERDLIRLISWVWLVATGLIFALVIAQLTPRFVRELLWTYWIILPLAMTGFATYKFSNTTRKSESVVKGVSPLISTMTLTLFTICLFVLISVVFG